MAKKCLSFLLDSFLFLSDAVETNYSTYQELEILSELKRYREYVLRNIEDIKSEIKHTHDKLNISVESFKKLPTEDLYKQLILYMDQVVIPDPLFELTEEQNPMSETVGEYMGLQKASAISREKIVDIINYIKCITPLIEANFVVMLPISLIHESPKEIAIKYSPTAFSDVIPSHILDYYRSIVKVYNLEKCEHGLRMDSTKPLIPGTQIYVDFPDVMKSKGHIYQYMLQEIVEFDEKTGKAAFRMHIPDTIDEQTFKVWVNQSINQSANYHFKEKYSEVVLAQKCGCMYLARSPLTAKILQFSMDAPTKDSELANLAMQFDLPVVNALPIADILEIRNNYGEAFHNFRNELNSKLIGLDSISDPDVLKKQLETISYELSNVQVKEVEKEYRKISRTLKLDALALTGSLIASFATGGITAIGVAGAFVKGVSDVSKYYTDVKENNGFFLWQLNKQAKKY